MSVVSGSERGSLRRWGKYLAAALLFQAALALLVGGAPRQPAQPETAAVELELVPARPLPVASVPAGPPPSASPPPRQAPPANPYAARPAIAASPVSPPQAPPVQAAREVAQAAEPSPLPGGVEAAPSASPVSQSAAGGSPSAAPSPTGAEGASAGRGTAGTGGEGEGEARPDYLHNPPPKYPPLARRRGLSGRVVLKVRVGSDGLAREVAVRTSSGHALLDEAAASTVSRWRFMPARRGEMPVESWVDVPIRFELRRGEGA